MEQQPQPQPVASPAPTAAVEHQYQHQQTYTGQPQPQPVYYQTMMPQQQIGSRPSREALYSRRWNIAKMVLRGSDIVSAIIVLALSIYYLFAFYNLWLSIIFTLPASGAVLIWEVAELITLCARGGRTGIHPGAHVGLHLVFWMYLLVGLVFFAIFAAYNVIDEYSYYYYDLDTPTAGPAYAIMAFLAIMTILNFVLFVRACVETAQINRQARTVFMIPAGVNGQMPQGNPHMSMAYPPQAYMYPVPMQQQPRESMYNTLGAPQTEGKALGSEGGYQGASGEGASGGVPAEYYAPTNNYGTAR
ncbi:hypothetical protein F5X68DRAFT_263771 [Plectosphaerella plurivora]|uniref:Uncharacterized protein n=1 Tax=Plectosphaerella plurivora TaxID=936078 RepID=A0A9P8V639_9PEZI|nr:hypothetical protein F5X68DRAFT_263771 [Plectosphaerella plurivora]